MIIVIITIVIFNNTSIINNDIEIINIRSIIFNTSDRFSQLPRFGQHMGTSLAGRINRYFCLILYSSESSQANMGSSYSQPFTTYNKSAVENF